MVDAPIPPDDLPLVLFDGECGLCDRSVRFIARHDPRGRIKFTPLQSEIGRREKQAAGLPADYTGSVLLIDETGLHKESEAALRIGRMLNQPWALLARVGLLVPRFLRDAVYRLIARWRKTLFPMPPACQIASPELRERFRSG